MRGASMMPPIPEKAAVSSKPPYRRCDGGGGSAIDSSITSIYEDGGDNADYATNFRRTAIRREGSRVTIASRKGAYTLKFPLAAVPHAVKVNGKTQSLKKPIAPADGITEIELVIK